MGGKVKVIDIFNKRQKFLPEDEWLMYKDEDGTTVPALVSEELWQAANEVFKRRSIDVKRAAQLLHTQEHLYRKTVLY